MAILFYLTMWQIWSNHTKTVICFGLKQGKWTWTTTHETASYTNWLAGEPNNLSGEDCAVMLLTGWFDLDCDRNDDTIGDNVTHKPVHALCEHDN